MCSPFSLKRQDSFEVLVLAQRDGSHRQRMESKQDRQQYHYNHHRQVLMWSQSDELQTCNREIEAGRQTLVAESKRGELLELSSRSKPATQQSTTTTTTINSGSSSSSYHRRIVLCSVVLVCGFCVPVLKRARAKAKVLDCVAR